MRKTENGLFVRHGGLPELSLPPGSMSPKYGSYCISGIPSTVMDLLGAEPVASKMPDDAFGDVDVSGVDNVVLIIMDGFGMSAWRRQQKEGFVKTISSKGNVRPITTVFPSTTAAALTTLATGLTPQEHGLPEWFVYMKNLDAIVATLPFSFMQDNGRETLRGHMRPQALFRGEPIFEKLKEAEVKVHSLVNRALAGTSYTSLVHKASEKVAFSSASDMVAYLRRGIESARKTSFFYVYWSYIDTIEHRYGPSTDESELEASSISFVLQRGLLDKLDRASAKRTLLLVTADHGQVNVDPEKTRYLDRYQTLVKSFERSRAGNPILPTGSARDVFLHVSKDRLDEVFEYLSKRVSRFATVVRVSDAISEGLFGLNAPSRKFLERAGNLLVLPKRKEVVWYRFKGLPPFDLRGHHGGLHPDEMAVPFASARMSSIVT